MKNDAGSCSVSPATATRKHLSAAAMTDEGDRTVLGARTFRTHTDLAPEIQLAMIELINQPLAATFDLYSQLKQDSSIAGSWKRICKLGDGAGWP